MLKIRSANTFNSKTVAIFFIFAILLCFIAAQLSLRNKKKVCETFESITSSTNANACPPTVAFATQDSVKRLEDKIDKVQIDLTNQSKTIQTIQTNEIPSIKKQLADHQVYINLMKQTQKELQG
jgi:hypothetical protein